MEAYDKDKPVYQMDWGTMPPGNMWLAGKWSQRTVEVPDVSKHIRMMELQRGADMMWYGMWIAIACIVVHGCSSLTMLKRVAEYGIVGGVLAIIGGMLYKQMVEHEKIIFLLVGLAFAWWVLSHKKIRDWSISHLIKKPNSSGSQSKGNSG